MWGYGENSKYTLSVLASWCALWWCGLWLSVYAVGGEQVENVTLYVDVDLENPTWAQVHVDTRFLGSFTLVAPRAREVATRGSPVLEISCDRGTDSVIVAYGEPIQCETLRWTVSFLSLESTQAQVFRQQNIYSSEGWWALFEWDSIPQFEPDTRISVCGRVQAQQQDSVCQPLLKETDAPLLLIWGQPGIRILSGGMELRIYTDEPGRQLLGERQQSRLLRQFQYLAALMPHNDAPTDVIDVAWVGLDTRSYPASGAAGTQAMLSNYGLRRGQVDPSQEERLFWVSGHELFHILCGDRFPLWVSESLAHYYGYKSLAKFEPLTSTPIHEWQGQLPFLRHSGIGLYDIHLEITRDKNFEHFSVIYSKGAAFWQQLDLILGRQGGDVRSLFSIAG